ncbi:YdeI/OmpD-associated family protein [Mariniblastus fucicola]|uniref:YdhG-like domain-containing protein n=1 Tax=Mariniblastus fucicola TaxID=980251 RepID=A0A5B9PQ33_9BACT|nr:DUF1801 domain-containing protein [Mariniblastus fucicola]QEG24403.1 hypothetical protein MFFC18_43220 [Mariniblastus fucicola]
MAKMKKPKSVEDYIASQEKWDAELTKLRETMLSTGLEETIKWSIPVYVHNGKNVVGIAGFKNHFGVWFYEGAELPDPQDVLTNAQEGKTQSMRHWKMASAKDIKVRALKAYVKEAMKVAATKKVTTGKRKKNAITFEMPPELAAVLKKDRKAAAAFGKLSPGKQRDYAEHISTAKREATKLTRLEKILPMIRDGVGLHDKYRNC